MTMSRHFKTAAYAMPLAAFLLAALACGCGKEEPAAPEQPATPEPGAQHRMMDPEYRERLQRLHKTQVEAARKNSALRKESMKFFEQAAKNLPEGASREQVRKELDEHPDKYPGWKELGERMEKAQNEARQNAQRTRRAVRERLLAEREKNLATNGKNGN